MQHRELLGHRNWVYWAVLGWPRHTPAATVPPGLFLALWPPQAALGLFIARGGGHDTHSGDNDTGAP